METNYETWSTERLVKRIYDLEATIEAFKVVNSDNKVLTIKDKFKITLKQARLLAALSDGRPHSKRALYEFVYHDDFDDPPEMKIIDVFMVHVRKKIFPFGMTIETIHGAGYRLLQPETIDLVISGRPPTIVQGEATSHSHRKYGENARIVLSVLIAAMEPSGKTKMMAREIAKKAALKVPLLPIMRNLEKKGTIKVLSQPTQKHRSAPWLVQVKARAL